MIGFLLEQEERPMPHNWMILDANTPEPWQSLSGNPTAYEAQVDAVVRGFTGASLVDLFWDATDPIAYALVKGPKNPVDLRALAKALPTIDVVQMLDGAEVRRALNLAKTTKPKPKPRQRAKPKPTG
jgi:hypothetical protein